MRRWRRRYTRRYGQPTRVESSLMKRLNEYVKTKALPVRFGPVLVGYWFLPFQKDQKRPFMSVPWITSLRCINNTYRPNILSVYGNMYSCFPDDIFVEEDPVHQAAFFDQNVRASLSNLDRRYGSTVPYIRSFLSQVDTAVGEAAAGLQISGLSACRIYYNNQPWNACVPLTCLVRKKVPKIVVMMGVMAFPRSYVIKDTLHDSKYIEKKTLFKPPPEGVDETDKAMANMAAKADVVQLSRNEAFDMVAEFIRANRNVKPEALGDIMRIIADGAEFLDREQQERREQELNDARLRSEPPPEGKQSPFFGPPPKQ